MQDYEFDAWLGGTTVTAEQRQIIHRAVDMIDARWPEPDDEDERAAALTGAAMLVLGDTTDEDLAAAAYTARRASIEAQASLTGAIIAGSLLSPAESEQARASRLGIARDTVRKALGK